MHMSFWERRYSIPSDGNFWGLGVGALPSGFGLAHGLRICTLFRRRKIGQANVRSCWQEGPDREQRGGKGKSACVDGEAPQNLNTKFKPGCEGLLTVCSHVTRRDPRNKAVPPWSRGAARDAQSRGSCANHRHTGTLPLGRRRATCLCPLPAASSPPARRDPRLRGWGQRGREEATGMDLGGSPAAQGRPAAPLVGPHRARPLPRPRHS